MSFSKNKIIITLILIVLLYVILIFISDVKKIHDVYFVTNWYILLPFFGVLFLTIFVRSLIQLSLLKEIDIKLSIKDSFILYLSSLSMLITPGGSGLLIKCHFLNKKFNLSYSKTAPLVFIERLLDFFGIIIFTGFTLNLVYSSESSIITIASSLIFITMIIMLKTNKFFSKFILFSQKIKFLKIAFANQSEFNLSLKKMLNKKLFLFFSIVIGLFFIDAIVIYLGFLAFDVDFGYVESGQIYYTSILLGLLSFIPGGMGITEGGMAGLIIKKNIDIGSAMAIVLFLRFCTIWAFTGIGAMTAYISNYYNSKTKNPEK